MITESASQSITPVVKALLDPLSEGVIVFSPAGEFLYANGAAEVAVPGLKENGTTRCKDIAVVGQRIQAGGGGLSSHFGALVP